MEKQNSCARYDLALFPSSVFSRRQRGQTSKFRGRFLRHVGAIFPTLVSSEFTSDICCVRNEEISEIATRVGKEMGGGSGEGGGRRLTENRLGEGSQARSRQM